MSIRKRNAIMRDIAMKFLEEGKVLSRGEYDRCGTVPVRTALIIGQFGSWARMVNLMRANMPEVFAEIEANQMRAEIPEVEEEAKKDPLEALADLAVSKTT